MRKIKILSLISSLLLSVSGSTNCLARGLDYAELSGQRLAGAVVALEKKMAHCEAAETIVDAVVLRSLALTEEQLAAALGYFHVKTSNECLLPEAALFVLAATVAAHQQTPTTIAETQTDYAELMLASFRREIELEARYLALPQDVRARLNSITSLKRPFALIETIQSLKATAN